jgi:sporulation protein YlmC with PRC-barrel domain
VTNMVSPKCGSCIGKFEVVEINEAIFCDEVDDAMLVGHLHIHPGSRSGPREENVHSLFREHRIGRVVINFHNVQLVGDDIAMSI